MTHTPDCRPDPAHPGYWICTAEGHTPNGPDLAELIADARTALAFDAPTPAVVDALAGTLTALVNALDPNGAQK